MIDLQRFESLLEGLSGEIEDLPNSPTKENLIGISDALYGLFEDIASLDFDEIKKEIEENHIMKKLLVEYLTEDDKQYYNIKYELGM